MRWSSSTARSWATLNPSSSGTKTINWFTRCGTGSARAEGHSRSKGSLWPTRESLSVRVSMVLAVSPSKFTYWSRIAKMVSWRAIKLRRCSMRCTRRFWYHKFHQGNFGTIYVGFLISQSRNAVTFFSRSTPSTGIPPQIIYTTPVHGEAIHKRKGETLRLECQVDGIPPPSIVWYKVSSTFAL